MPCERYRAVYEPGCATGVLSELLALRCDRLLSTDHSEAALARARPRLAAFPHVELQRQSLPNDWPDERFPLYAYHPSRHHTPARTRVFLDFIVALTRTG